MRHQTIALFLIGLAMASCSADPKSAVGASLSGGVRFQHRVHERNDGKTMLIVTPVRGLVQDSTIIERGARTYAEAFANQTCTRGYNFFGHGPPGGWKAEHTFVFQCTQMKNALIDRVGCGPAILKWTTLRDDIARCRSLREYENLS